MQWIKHLHYNYFCLFFNSLQTSLVSKDEKLVIKVSIQTTQKLSLPGQFDHQSKMGWVTSTYNCKESIFRDWYDIKAPFTNYRKKYFFRIGMILMALAENGSQTQRSCAPAVLIGFKPNILEKAAPVKYFSV